MECLLSLLQYLRAYTSGFTFNRYPIHPDFHSGAEIVDATNE